LYPCTLYQLVPELLGTVYASILWPLISYALQTILCLGNFLLKCEFYHDKSMNCGMRAAVFVIKCVTSDMRCCYVSVIY
jgi:hypothetical protein